MQPYFKVSLKYLMLANMKNKYLLVFYMACGFQSCAADKADFGLGYHILEMIQGECSLLLFDVPPRKIQTIIMQTEVGRLDAPLTFYVTNSIDFNIETSKKESQCFYGLSTLNKSRELQQVLLPSNDRQLILLADEIETDNTQPVKVHPRHHPILSVHAKGSRKIQKVACTKSSQQIVTNICNIYTGSWLRSPSKTSLELERTCNKDKHPLHGKHLTGNVFAIPPFLLLNFETHMIEGGAVMDIIETIAQHFEFTYQVSFPDNIFMFYPNGSIGGALGEVVNGEVDFSLEQAYAVGGFVTTMTSLTYNIPFVYIELKPKQVPLFLNITYPFDGTTWLSCLLSFVLVWLSMYLLLMKQANATSKAKTMLDIFEMMYGIMFQEYHRGRNADRQLSTTKFRFMWVAITTFLAMAFSGNLKSSFVRRNYEKRTMTLDEMIDKDMTVHMSSSFVDVLTSSIRQSRFNTRLLCQVRKKNSSFPISSNLFDQMYEKVLEHGGVSNMHEQSVQVLRNRYLKSGKDFPLSVIPERYFMMAHAICFQKYDRRANYFNPVIDAMRETGLIDFFFRKLMPPRDMKDPKVEVKEEALVIDYFYLPFMCWIVGLTVGVILILGEVLVTA